jgi:two-component system phosphate regulon sensor histidine kinase PhoR
LQKIAWKRELLRIIIVVVIATAAGMSFDKPFWGAFIGLIVSQILILHRLNELFRWSNKQGEAPQDNGLVGYSADAITRRERSLKKKINSQDKQLNRIVEGIESLQDGILLINNVGMITAFNRAACHLLGLRKDTDKGQHITSLLRAPRFVKYFNKADYSDPIDLESPYRSNLMVQVQVTQFGVAQKIIMVRDITERQRVETMKQNFIADISHELRTPLTVISGYLEMLADADLNPAIARAIQQMGEQSERMKQLVNDLLHLSKLESNNSGIGNEWFKFNPLCSEVVDQLRAYTPSTSAQESFPQVKIQCDCLAGSDKSHVEIFGFEDELKSILTNLITNAIKYGHKKGQAAEVNVITNLTNLGLEIAIKDKGNGIDASHLSRLTERFYRVDESRESTVGGTGLGLAIVRHALEHHDAQLKIESTLGIGSCFSFIIPSERIRAST